MTDNIKAGAYIEIAHPFIRDEWGGIPSWKPGTRFCDSGEGYLVADGVGTQIIHIISKHKPGRFPTRIFYTRRWRDPAGNEFGKLALRITSIGNFRRIISGYRHEYELGTDNAIADATQNTKAIAQ